MSGDVLPRYIQKLFILKYRVYQVMKSCEN